MAQPPEVSTTQRAYTLRLNRSPGNCPHCKMPQCDCWRKALWATHEAVNKGAQVFGDWLLTFPAEQNPESNVTGGDGHG